MPRREKSTVPRDGPNPVGLAQFAIFNFPLNARSAISQHASETSTPRPIRTERESRVAAATERGGSFEVADPDHPHRRPLPCRRSRWRSSDRPRLRRGRHLRCHVAWTSEGRRVSLRMRMQEAHIGYCVTRASRTATILSKP
jgi:hypothetical protein